MKSYIARQPILDRTGTVNAYELLYRGGEISTSGLTTDEEAQDAATRTVISNAVTVFGLKNLTNGKRAYINFPERLLLDDTALLLNANEVMIEILEQVTVTDELVSQVKKLKARGYAFALDDYTGDPSFEPLLPLVSVVKVDFLLANADAQKAIAARLARRGPVLLAEKVEDEETFLRAKKQGYRFFQGYFFEKPLTIAREAPKVNEISMIQLLKELNRTNADLNKCATIIRKDAYLTYQLLRSVGKMQYYRGNSINAIEYAVAFLGINELLRWTLLIFGRGMNHTYSDETVRQAYLRGVFTERLMGASRHYQEHKGEGFLLGMFSMMEAIMDTRMEKLLQEISLPERVKKCLLGAEESFYSRLLSFVIDYERNPGDARFSFEEEIPGDQVTELYMQSAAETDEAFKTLESER